MSTYEENRSSLEDLKNDFEKLEVSNLNEANTRFKYIDSLLIDCLGWDKADISCEDSHDRKYTDYILSLFRSVAIVEAKRMGNYFELPIGKQSLFQPLKSVYKDNENVKKAIDQVRGYCNDRSIQIAIVCNGWQIIAFIANRNDSLPVLEGKALIVPSIESFLDNFKEVWNCLSKTGFKEEYLQRLLLGKDHVELPPKLSSTIHQYPGIKNRNPFQTEIEIISDLVLEDVIKDKSLEVEFLESCYCTSGALSSYSLVSKAILSTRYNYLFETADQKATLEQVANKKGLSGDLVELFSNSLSKRPVLLVGDVGVGKSTFIDYLRFVEAPKIFEKAISIKINLGEGAIVDLNIKKAILNVIKTELYQQYGINIEEDDFVRHCYHVDLNQFKQSVKVKRLYDINHQEALLREIEFLSNKIDNEADHLRLSLEYISKSQKKQIIIFIDNCDQRSDEDQETAFLVSQEFASKWPVLVFISLRPETFHRTKKGTGALSGYHTKAFTIPPPRIDEVIRKRLVFAQKITSGEIPLTKLDNKTSFTQLHTLIDVFRISMDRNDSLLTFLNNVSNENIRKAIELIKSFFGSGHVDMEKILRIHLELGGYTVPLHELLRSVIFGNNIHYAPTNTEIINIYDIRILNNNDHFIIPKLIGILDDYSSNNRNHGFISVPDLFEILQGQGFNTNQIDKAINFAYSKKLFEISHKGDKLDLQKDELYLRATNLAIYHLRFLANIFTYIDAILIDTPIINAESRSKISNVMKIQDRLNRANEFRLYLNSCWEQSKLNEVYFDWNRLSQELNDDIKRIKSKI